eukprot:TRINITY_DN42001_c0_g1_i1.p1 TRINITY_DN42001_c0_g1~~TRINITY_DN42001_c0_g1_i1.p1  ORF type:complete len:289 (-),score=27.29 TRINITY_DN42001_c0_g1_i1:176-1042(-)
MGTSSASALSGRGAAALKHMQDFCKLPKRCKAAVMFLKAWVRISEKVPSILLEMIVEHHVLASDNCELSLQAFSIRCLEVLQRDGILSIDKIKRKLNIVGLPLEEYDRLLRDHARETLCMRSKPVMDIGNACAQTVICQHSLRVCFGDIEYSSWLDANQICRLAKTIEHSTRFRLGSPSAYDPDHFEYLDRPFLRHVLIKSFRPDDILVKLRFSDQWGPTDEDGWQNFCSVDDLLAFVKQKTSPNIGKPTISVTSRKVFWSAATGVQESLPLALLKRVQNSDSANRRC